VTSTLGATLLLALAAVWPVIEPIVVEVLVLWSAERG
jgi:hypothetical protein